MSTFFSFFAVVWLSMSAFFLRWGKIAFAAISLTIHTPFFFLDERSFFVPFFFFTYDRSPHLPERRSGHEAASSCVFSVTKKKKNVGGLYIGITRNALSLHYRNIRRPDNVVNDRCKSSAVITAKKKKKKTKECRYKRIRNIARSIADGRRRPSYSRH
jgi:hypothetical protein